MTTLIRDIADVGIGYQFRGKVEPSDDANVLLVQIKDVDDRLTLQLGNLVSVRVEKPQSYLVAPGNVLFLSRGQNPFAVVVPEVQQNTIVTSYFLILRPNQALVRPAYLAWILNQTDFQESLRPVMRGTHIKILSKSDFQNLPVILPPLAVQDYILNLHHLVDREQSLSATLLQKRGELAQAVSRQILFGRLQIQEPSHGE